MSSGNSERKNKEKGKEKENKKDEDERIKQIKENLTCSATKKKLYR